MCSNILLEDFNTKIRREEYFKTTTGLQSLHQQSNNNGYGLIELTTLKGLIIKKPDVSA